MNGYKEVGRNDVIVAYGLLTEGPALVDRAYRGLLEITGKDRASWLHNLTTNAVKTLQPGEGNYAFALNLQGRILFDLNILVQTDSILVDLDRLWLPTATAHFKKYTIVEDVSVRDLSDASVRWGLVGRRSGELLSSLGASNAPVMAYLSTGVLSLGDIPITFIRTDFCGPFGVECLAPAERAMETRQRLTEAARSLPATPAGADAVEIQRIEFGIPWPGREITDEYLPAETRQQARAVSFQKGCYLGQEVVERMRSRHVVARQLALIRVEGGEVPIRGAALLANDKPAGQVTSSCHSIKHGGPLALGYVKTAASATGTPLTVSWDGRTAGGTVLDLPSASAN